MLLIDLDFQEKDEHDEVWNEEGLIGFGDNLWVIQYWILTSKRKTGRPAKTSMRK